MANDNHPKITYIYDLPYRQRRQLRDILDENDRWEDLAGNFMGLPQNEINYMRRQRSPTDVLLDTWGQKNHTVQELFVLLSRMEHYRAMRVLQEFIDVKYHSLIVEGDDSISRLLSSLKTAPKKKTMNVAAAAVDVDEPNFNVDKDLNIRCNYDNFAMKPEEKKLNIVIPATERNDTLVKSLGGDVARAISPGKASSSGESLGKNHSRESNMLTEEIKRTVSEIPFRELEKATNNWNENNILGKGGFGTVYVGEWKETKVAVKVFKKRPDSDDHGKKQNQAQLEQLINEMQVLDSIRHDNILSVYGFSFGEGLVPCIVYQLMENGSLEDRLQCKKGTVPLTWYQRYEIARGTARGLQFLHTKGARPLIHGDIKSANILLDANMKPYIGDFGLVTEGPIPTLTHMTVMNVNGTKPYLPFDYLHSRQISTKVDTYSFGIVMFEITTGMRAYEKRRKPAALIDLIRQKRREELSDRKVPLLDSVSWEIFNELFAVGKMCSADNAKERPEVVEVFRQLEKMSIPSRPPSVANLYSQDHQQPMSPMDMQKAYDKMNRQRTISGDSSIMGGRPMIYSRPFAPSPSINIPEFMSTPSTLPTQTPLPQLSPLTNFRHSPISFHEYNFTPGQPVLMVQPANYACPVAYMNSPLLTDQQQPLQSPYTPQPEPIQEHSECSGTKFLPTVLPGDASKEAESSMDSTCNLPLLTKLGIKSVPAAETNQTQDSGRESEKDESENTDEGNEDK